MSWVRAPSATPIDSMVCRYENSSKPFFFVLDVTADVSGFLKSTPTDPHPGGTPPMVKRVPQLTTNTVRDRRFANFFQILCCCVQRWTSECRARVWPNALGWVISHTTCSHLSLASASATVYRTNHQRIESSLH